MAPHDLDAKAQWAARANLPWISQERGRFTRARRRSILKLPRRLTRSLALLLLLLLLAALLVRSSWRFLSVAPWHRWTQKQHDPVPPTEQVDKAVVLAKMLHENVEWVHDLRPDWTPYIYTTASPPEPGYTLVPPVLRGREAMIYLSFIIDHYDRLPNITAFIHASNEQRHNEDLGPLTSTILQNLRIDTVLAQGYVNLRCKQDPGCPVGVNPWDPTEIDIKGRDIRAYFADVYMELFDVPPSGVPTHIGNVCCGQFALSKEQIRKRPVEDYVRMRRWAIESTVTDSFGVGWVFEKVWHIVFGKEAQYCPTQKQCRCDLFGWCGPIPEECAGPRDGTRPGEEESRVQAQRRDL